MCEISNELELLESSAPVQAFIDEAVANDIFDDPTNMRPAADAHYASEVGVGSSAHGTKVRGARSLSCSVLGRPSFRSVISPPRALASQLACPPPRSLTHPRSRAQLLLPAQAVPEFLIPTYAQWCRPPPGSVPEGGRARRGSGAAAFDPFMGYSGADPDTSFDAD